MSRRLWATLERVTENGLRNTRIPWNAGKTTGMLFLQFLNFQPIVRKVIYTTNAINHWTPHTGSWTVRRRACSNDTALLKALYLATFEATKKWTTTIRDWAQVYGELSIMYEGRLPE